MFKTLAATGVAVLTICTSSAIAAERSSSWTGFYLGANVGYGFSSLTTTAGPGDPNTALSIAGKPVIPALAASYDRNGWLGGVHAGYDWQFSPRWLVGIEADFDWADLSGGGSSATSFMGGQSTGTFNASQKIDWFGTLRARLGVLPTPDLLLYATGGLAYGKVNDSANLVMNPGQSNSIGNFGYGFGCGGIYGSSTCFAGSSSRTSAGWAAGAGGEYRVTSNLALRVEYLYVDLGTSNFILPAVTYFGLKPSQLNGSADAAFNLVRFGASYRF